jgi:hypothetical protein
MVIDSSACTGDTTTRLFENASRRDPGLPFSPDPRYCTDRLTSFMAASDNVG